MFHGYFIETIEKGDVMVTTSQRIHVTVTRTEKRIIAKKAAQAGISIGEYLKLSAAAYRPDEYDQLLEWLIDQMTKSANRSIAAIDESLAFVDASNKRIAAYEKNARNN